jgi:hypothetical protein
LWAAARVVALGLVLDGLQQGLELVGAAGNLRFEGLVDFELGG